MNLKDISKISEENLVAHEIWGEGKKSQRCIMFHIWVTGGLISLKTYIDMRRRVDFRGKIINLTLDMLILRGIFSSKSSGIQN